MRLRSIRRRPCGWRAAIQNAQLKVHDGRFILRGKSLTLDGGKLVADCPQAFEGIGYRVEVAEGITFVANSGSKMTARCEVGGGAITLNAPTSVTIAALGIDANGSATDAPGGSVSIEASISAPAPSPADRVPGSAA